MSLPRWFSLVVLLAVTFPGHSLEPKHVFLLVNKNEPTSKQLAEHYCKLRAVPVENIISLDLPTGEDISRKDYNTRLVEPLRIALNEKREQAKVLLSIYGVPLRVGTEEPSQTEKEELKKLDQELQPLQAEENKLRDKIAELEKKKDDPDGLIAAALSEAKDKQKSTQADIQRLNRRRSFLSHAESQAAVDSELMLLWWDKYELRRWVVNPLNFQFPDEARKKSSPVVMTCRLDGPTPELVRRIMDTSLEVEKVGLKGKVYVDARGIRFNAKGEPGGTGYGGYDESMREMATLLDKEAKLPVVLDDKPDVFAVNACPDCALYCGWYSHANFVDSCRFTKGAVAWHLASSEAVSLRRKDAKFWCKNLLEQGAVATLGPVAEPYTIGFPKPAEFFGLLATGKYPLVECYSRTVMLTSWMGVLVGDPLYTPFAKNPCLKEELVVPSPKGVSSPFGKMKQ